MVVQGREVHDLYILTRGAGDVRIAVPDAPPRIVSRITAPDIFGEMGMLTGEPRRATVVAVGETECWRLGKEKFREVLHERPAIAEEVSRILAARQVELATATEGLSEEIAPPPASKRSTGRSSGRIERFFGLGRGARAGERERTMRETKLFLAGAWEEGDGRSSSARRGTGSWWRSRARRRRRARSGGRGGPGGRSPLAALPAERVRILEAARRTSSPAVRRGAWADPGRGREADRPRARGDTSAPRHSWPRPHGWPRSPRSRRATCPASPAAPGGSPYGRVPVGPVLAITPFNFPLNLVAHKLAPAVAAGCPIVLKPASQTPSPALLLAESSRRRASPTEPSP